MRRSADFRSVVRGGLRARTGRIVVHHRPDLQHSPDLQHPHDPPSRSAAPLVGFVVSKAVGNSVQRHAVTRKLRAQLAARVSDLPATSGTVVRALPPAAQADSATLSRDLDLALTRIGRARGAAPAAGTS
ncbi:ribonuclease P protein component [uncultured Jatrophihabitans sp.]|uniref:ribonuclease P protein component n=1 Tax=uncultured Jatrophihabitans sp. TaxID=1610747 RepID=UPI0035CA9982